MFFSNRRAFLCPTRSLFYEVPFTEWSSIMHDLMISELWSTQFDQMVKEAKEKKLP